MSPEPEASVDPFGLNFTLIKGSPRRKVMKMPLVNTLRSGQEEISFKNLDYQEGNLESPISNTNHDQAMKQHLKRN